jgi:hypothetical protein
MPGGRPTEPVPQDIADAVIAWIADGKTLREFCRQDGKPSYGTIYNWIEKDEQFASRFACAREQGEDVIAQECLQIADDGSNDWQDTEYGPKVNQEHIQRSRLRVDTRLKLLAKWNPKKYGERSQVALTDPDGGPLVIVSNIPRPGDK